MATSATRNICISTMMRWGVSSSRNRFVNMVVASQIHQIDTKDNVTQTPCSTECPCANAELRTMIAATKTRS